MNHIEILRRAFEITRRYRALWVFGFLLALTTGGGGGNSGSSVNNGGGGGGNGSFTPPDWATPEVVGQIVAAAFTIGLALLCLFLIVGIVFTIVRYVAETAAIRMVNRREETGEEVGVRAGFRLGWSQGALRIFLIDLLFGVAGFIVFGALFLLAALPLFAWVFDNEPIGVLGTIVAVGLLLMVILLAIVVSLGWSLVVQFVRRASILEDLGVFDSIRRGFDLVRRRLGDIILMGVIVVAIGLAIFLLMIPLAILLLVISVLVGGLPAVLAGSLVSLFAEGAAPYIIGFIVGFPIFLLVMIVPLTFITGLLRAFQSSVWTLTYREIVALEALEPEVES